MVWDAATRSGIGELIGHRGTVYAVALGSVAGREVIVSGSRDGTVMVWDAATRRGIGELIGHRGTVYAVALGRCRRAGGYRLRLP